MRYAPPLSELSDSSEGLWGRGCLGIKRKIDFFRKITAEKIENEQKKFEKGAEEWKRKNG